MADNENDQEQPADASKKAFIQQWLRVTKMLENDEEFRVTLEQIAKFDGAIGIGMRSFAGMTDREADLIAIEALISARDHLIAEALRYMRAKTRAVSGASPPTGH